MNYISNRLCECCNGYDFRDNVIDCIGLEFLGPKRCEIKHIAVSPNHRKEGIGSKIISFIKYKHQLFFVPTETGKDAVNFYEITDKGLLRDVEKLERLLI